MTNRKSTKKALLTSVLCLMLCFSMLVGTTFAWFTDEVKSGVNQIIAGNLDVELYHADKGTNGESKPVDGGTLLFDDVTLWEPGAVAYEKLTVANEGTLALKYALSINFTDENTVEGYGLSSALQVAVVEGNVTSREAAIKAGEGKWENLKDFTLTGALEAGKNGEIPSDSYTIVIYWEPGDDDNNWNVNNGKTTSDGKEYLHIDLGVKLVATQKDAESDSFGNDYDKNASVVVENGGDLAAAIKQVEDGGIVFIEPGEYNLKSGPIVIEGKTVTIIGLGDVTLNKNYGNTHIFTVKNGADVTIENVTMDGKGNTREGIYVRWNSKVTLEDVVIKNTGGSDIMIDEASDAAHGENTASYVWLINSHIEDVAMCASPVTSVAATQDTYVYFNYDAKSTVGAIDVQSINLKPENIIINGVKSTEVGKTMYLNVTNDAELAAALETIKTNEAYWNKQVIVNLAAGTYSGDYVINQYPEWNGVVGAGSTANNYASGVPAGAPSTVITFVGETASTYSLRAAATTPAVAFTGNVTVKGFGNAGAGFGSATAITTFKNIAFDAANSADNEEDYIVMYVEAAANNVNFEGCTFQNATHVTLGGAASDAAGTVNVDGCTFNDGGCLSGYVETLNVSNSTVTAAKNGFINKAKAGEVTVTNCDINAGRYFIRTSNSGVELTVEDSKITIYEAEGTKHLVYFRGSNESAVFIDCTIADGYTTAGVDAKSTLEIYNYSETEDGLTLVTDGITNEVTLYEVPAEYEGTTVTVPEGVTTIGNYAFASNSNVKEVILASTVRDLGRGFDSSTVEKVVLNEGLTTISSRAFRATANLKEVVISSTVTTIADNAFQKSGIKTITIPTNVKTIGETAFGASLVETVIIEGNVNIEGFAFRGCTKLSKVYLNGYDVNFVKSTLNGRNSMWFCNGESNNPNTSDIDFYVKNEAIKERVLVAMGAERNNTDVYCEEVADDNGVYTDETTGKTYAYANDATTLNTAISGGADTVYLGSGNYIIPDSAQGKTLTIVGNGDTVVASQDDGAAEGDCDYSFDGATVTFENVTITTSTTYFPGYARMKATYNNCTINGVYTLYDNSTFNTCTFNVSGDVYNVWTWGATEATFIGCTFNNDGKAVLLYGQVNTKLTLNNCVFNDNGDDTVTGKAAVEIGNDYNKSYTLIVNNTTVNGYAVNSNGISTGTTLWANKNSMGTDKLNVEVDGIDVY